jgi:hypothetical protein
MHNRILLMAFILPLLLPTFSSAVTPDEAASAVKARYRITTPAFLGGFNEIGSILTPRREGLLANKPGRSFVPNVVKAGKVVAPGGGDLPLGGSHSGTLKPGERLHLYGVRTGDEYVQLDLYSVATYVVPGVRGPTPLQASLRFQYDGGLSAVTARQLLDDIGEWLATEGEAHPVPSEQASGPKTTSTPPGPRGTDTVRLGESMDEVVSVLGPPEKRILLGPKTVFVYPHLKVVFVDGKLTDAE